MTFGLLLSTQQSHNVAHKHPNHYLIDTITVKLLRHFDYADAAAIGTLAIIAGVTFYVLPYGTDWVERNLWTYILLFSCYLGCFLAATRKATDFTISLNVRYAFLIGQIASAFALMVLLPIDYLPILSIIWAAVLPAFFRFKVALLMVIAVVIAWFSLEAYLSNENTFFSGLLFGTFHIFALMAHHQTILATRAKEALEQKNAELLATQHLLAEANKQSERTRIARDLHDLLGHHLTALTINLQVASHLTDGDAKEKVLQCHQLSKLLLSDVREAVSMLRENQQLDLLTALKTIHAPGLSVDLNIEDTISIEDLQLAETILRCCQEAITNALKHSDANKVCISLIMQGANYHLNIKDNGNANPNIKMGNGLTGMKERIEKLQGQFAISTHSNALAYDIVLPKKGAAHG